MAARTDREKVALFRSLFRGREDVFARRWSRGDASGYAPVPIGRDKHSPYVPLTDEAVRDHLLGRHIVGLYPLLRDSTCWLLAIDFDKRSWREDVKAFASTCRQLEVPVAVECSRSGEGAHAWFFFEEPVEAALARRLGQRLITETRARHPRLPLRSYDRLFPSQDALKPGGLGNLIALPLQGLAVPQGNTLFVGDKLEPVSHQWDFLASVKRMCTGGVAALASGAAAPMPAKAASVRRPVPKIVHAILRSRLEIDKTALSSELQRELRAIATFHNPEFYKLQQQRRPTARTPRLIVCAEDVGERLVLPRACLAEVSELLAKHGASVHLEDRRHQGSAIEAAFRGELTDLQRRAVDALAAHDAGVFVAPPGIGKTVVGCWMIADRGRSALILVHRCQLLEQWRQQLSLFLGLARTQIGRIGGGRREITGRIDVATFQSLVRTGRVDEIVSRYGHVVVDECHRVPAFSFESLLSAAPARYVLGLTATPTRRDGRHPILHMQLGPARYTVRRNTKAAKRPFHHRVVVRSTEVSLPEEATQGIQVLRHALATDAARNGLIVDDIVHALEEGRTPLVLTQRKDHLELLAALVRPVARNVIVLRGGMKADERHTALDTLRALDPGDERVVLATGQFAGEGFDEARLDTLLLALPIAWSGTVEQYAGRIHRLHAMKHEVRIYDYVDEAIPMLARMFEKRRRRYRAMGYAKGHSMPALLSNSASRIVPRPRSRSRRSRPLRRHRRVSNRRPRP